MVVEKVVQQVEERYNECSKCAKSNLFEFDFPSCYTHDSLNKLTNLQEAYADIS